MQGNIKHGRTPIRNKIIHTSEVESEILSQIEPDSHPAPHQ